MRKYHNLDEIVWYGIVRHIALTSLDKIAHIDVYWLTGSFKGGIKSHLPLDLVVVSEY